MNARILAVDDDLTIGEVVGEAEQWPTDLDGMGADQVPATPAEFTASSGCRTWCARCGCAACPRCWPGSSARFAKSVRAGVGRVFGSQRCWFLVGGEVATAWRWPGSTPVTSPRVEGHVKRRRASVMPMSRPPIAPGGRESIERQQADLLFHNQNVPGRPWRRAANPSRIAGRETSPWDDLS